MAEERWPQAEFYQLELVRNGKAAGERMYRHYRARGVKTMPFIEVFIGAKLVERIDASALDLQTGDRL